MGRIHNFSAGPAVLPEAVLRTAQQELLDYRGKGLSVMEMSHRSPAFLDILEQAKQDIRLLANIPEDYELLFLQGGATTQFSMVPLNLHKNGKADYILSGHWAQKAAQEASRSLDVAIPASSEASKFDRIPDLSGLNLRPDADYVHICENNTIYGTSYHSLPDTGAVPLVSDQSSFIFSGPLDIRKYGLIYAGAQKNIGPAGLTLVIIRKDLIRERLPGQVPLMLGYFTHAKSNSMHNTPPTYAIYILGLVIRWLLDSGGLQAALARNQKKAGLLYRTLDESRLFHGTAHKDSRSLMNVPFTTGKADLDRLFLEGAQKEGMLGLAGYRSLGGMRASLYNALPYESVQLLCDYMKEFERKNPC